MDNKIVHIGGASWLERNYFGDVGLVCLVNPIEVVAVPWRSAEYGKIRTCAYLPIAKAEYGEDGHIIPFSNESGIEAPFVTKVLYEGTFSTEENPVYVIPVPTNTNGYTPTVTENVMNIARKYMNSRK